MKEPEKAMDGKYWMPCTVRPGKFSSECYVQFKDIEGKDVIVIEYKGHTKPNAVAVWILEVGTNRCLIRVQNVRDFEQIWVPTW